MPQFSKRSQDRLDTCHSFLVELFGRVVKGFDCTILEGARSQNRQMILLGEGKTKLKYPLSKHNIGLESGRKLSAAVDVIPYPIDWRYEGDMWDASQEHELDEYLEIHHNIERWFMFIGYVKGIAAEMGVPLICGADWDGDNCMADQQFDDLPHFEIKED